MAQSLLRQNWFSASDNDNNIKLEPVELNMFCRACVIETDETNSYPLDFTDIATLGDESLRQILEKVLGFELDETNEADSMPNRICENCYNRLTQFYMFRSECLQSNSALQKYLSRTVSEQNEDSNDTLFSVFEVKQEADVVDESAIGGNDFDESYDNFIGADDYGTDSTAKGDIIQTNPRNIDSSSNGFQIECFFGTGKGDERYKCINCNLKMTTVRAMYSHLAVHQPVRRDRTCQYCNRKFNAVAPLRRHLAVHSYARPFKCSICYRTYKRIDDLQAHFKVHQ